MDSFDEIRNLISKDKIQKVDYFFYSKIKQKIDELEKSQLFVFKIKRSHIFLSVAAGLLLGVFVGSIIQHHIWENKKVVLMESVLNSRSIETKINCEEFEMVTNLGRKGRHKLKIKNELL